ncbi:hypothetical protein BZL41_18925 [Pseudomonas sp. PIC25]|uniref:pectate lyase n=1 Tax=Pseudomonas sp. PIC25 TaxID=1958773 RepID=UPI000BAB2977|nr:pectate lyase [Pseudomonas sp. PIC25]PAU57199.1 hypothetical protein BZL41_18925 [Pseudomonas sp. PIC25]
MEIKFNFNTRPDAYSPQSDSLPDYKRSPLANKNNGTQDGRSFEEFAEQIAMALVAELLKGSPLLQQLLGLGNGEGNGKGSRKSDGLDGGSSLGQDFGSRFKDALFSFLDRMLSGEGGNVKGNAPSDGAEESNWPNSTNQFLQNGGTSLLNNSIAPTEDGGGQVQNKDVLKPISLLMDKHPEVFGTPSQKAETPATESSEKPFHTTTRNSMQNGTTPPSFDQFTKPVSLSQVPTGETPASTPSKSAPAKVDSTRNEGNFNFTKIQEGGAGGSSGVSFPKASSNPNVVNDTIVVKKGEVFDGKGQTFTAGSKLGDGGQSENQKPLFILEDGAKLENVVIGDNGADGVHVYGDAKVNNVHWTNVGEDALTIKPNKEGKKANVEITNSSAQGANDKIFQLNADANITIDNFKAKDFGTFLRTNGGQQGDWNINLKNITAEDGKYKFVNSDSEGVKVSAGNINLQNVHEHFRLSKSSTLNLA